LHDWWAFQTLDIKNARWECQFSKLLDCERPVVTDFVPADFAIEHVPLPPVEIWPPRLKKYAAADDLDAVPLEDAEDGADDGHEEPGMDEEADPDNESDAEPPDEDSSP
jgi:hypothetical protein